MNYDQANRILDRAKEGQQFSPAVITRALGLTGDIDPDRGEGMDYSLQEEDARGWEERSVLLVASYSGGHRQKAGPESCRGIAGTHERFERTE